MTESVYHLAVGLLDRELTPDQTGMLEQFCSSTWLACVTRLCPDVDQTQVEPALTQAAALLAAALLLDTSGAGEATSFTAGKLSVTTGAGTRANRYRTCAQELLRPWCDGDFAFVGVRG